MDTDEHETAYGIGELMERAAARAVPVVAGIADGDLARPTPCAQYTVKDLVNHLVQVLVQFRGLAAKEDSDFSATPDVVGEDPAGWRDRFAREAAELAAAWSRPGAEDGTSGAMNMPARLVGSMALLDLTVHAWDLARATGRSYEVPPEVVGTLRAAVAELAPTARKMNVFGAEVEVPDSASEFERLLAATGRRP
ncbi:TIGR03086 family protein [Streptomyces sp. SID5785]|uniref:TIGR03086 family metal-binding protein n=1 Tax=Streptomyces sp. SID5785 TaxID=2690309 RepID=UPI0013612F37|nr:TIGR03086 family metal-binding protein [Streptomyces sp. SID5785]MZD05618.1 TIGR03086 family protein [Streptomyces sp. SID5785]